MTKRSIFEIANKNKYIKDNIMKDCYLDLEKKENKVKFISTNVISLNLALSGKVNGGIPVGKISMIAAPSMLGKSYVVMSTIKNAQKKGMNVIIIDAERSFSEDIANSLGIKTDKNNMYIIRENSIEKITNFILNIFENMTKEEKENTFVMFDSWAVLVTSKTIEDGKSGKDVLDMTESKKKNKLANIILNTEATYFVINHVYDNIGGWGELLKIPGARRIIFNSDCVVVGNSRAKTKTKNKETKEEYVDGHIISMTTYKSRYSKEQTKLKFKIKHNGGLDPYYGILDDAIKGNYVTVHDGKPKKYSRTHIKDDTLLKDDDIYNAKFWKPIFKETDFKKYLENKYSFTTDSIILKEEKDLDEIFE